MSEQGEVKTDQAKVQRCMNMAAAYRASGHKAKVWAQANGVNDRMLSSWCAHAIRWQARADGIEPGAIQRKRRGVPVVAGCNAPVPQILARPVVHADGQGNSIGIPMKPSVIPVLAGIQSLPDDG